MEITRLSSKGQIIIPKAVRESHLWKTGTRFQIEETQAGILLKPVSGFPETDLQHGLGCTNYQGAPKSLEDISRSVDAELKRFWQGESTP